MKYIVTDSIKSVNRIIRRQNNQGTPTFGVEAITALGLAWQILIEKKSAEGLVPIRLINNNTASAIALEIILKNPSLLSFIPKESVSLATARELLNNINILRTNKYNECSVLRLSELLGFIDIYEKNLKERNLYDEPMVLSEAIAMLEEGSVGIDVSEIETCYYQVPSMIEEHFVSLLNPKGEFKKPENKVAEYEFVKTYGVSNEADYVAKTIIDNRITLGDIEIICDTAVYGSYIKECFTKRGLAFNFTSSVSGSGFNYIQILKNLLDWNLQGCKYEDLFKIMLNPIYGFEFEGKINRAASAFFKGISYGIGWGADRYFDVKRPEYDVSHEIIEGEYYKTFREIELPALGNLAKQLNNASMVVEALDALTAYGNIHKFKRNSENRYTTNALLTLRKSIAAVRIEFSRKEDMFEYLKTELDSISYTQGETNDAVNVSSIYTPACIERKHIFVLGMSAKEFKISVAESPILGDGLRKALFGDTLCGNVSLAENAIEDAEEIVRGFLKSAPEEAKITLISSSADNTRDGSEVATSALFEKLLFEAGKTEKDVIKADSYNEITIFDAIIPHDFAWKDYVVNWPAKEELYSKVFSKSSLDALLECPLKYHYEKDLYINKEEYTTYDPGRWLSASETGTLVHRILELYANTFLKGNTNVPENFDRDCKAFIDAVELATKEAESTNAAPNDSVKEKELNDCIEMATSYLTYLHNDLHNSGWVVFSCEEDMELSESTFKFNYNGTDIEIRFSGVIDRIDRKKNEDGTFSYRIQDYKTGKEKTASKMKKETKQHLIYAHYIEKKYAGTVDSFDYLYLKALLNGVSTWKAEIDSAELSKDVLSSAEQETIYKILAEHNYTWLGYDEDKCTYCNYKDICLYSLA